MLSTDLVVLGCFFLSRTVRQLFLTLLRTVLEFFESLALEVLGLPLLRGVIHANTSYTGIATCSATSSWIGHTPICP